MRMSVKSTHGTSYLVLTTENVGVVLCKTTDTGQASEGTRCFVAVENTKLGHADGKLPVRTFAVAKDETVAGAVHGLEGPLLLLDVKGKHVVLVVLPVSRLLPERRVVHVGREDLGVTALPVLGTNKRL